MLHVQKYLLSGGTLQSLHQKYNINYVVAEALGLVAVNHQTLSPMDDELVAECRALFLQLNTWEVAFKSMNGFYANFDPRGQKMLAGFDWQSARAYEKRDGALVGLYFFQGEWRVGSRFSAEGGWAAYGLNGIKHDYSWRELTQRAVEDTGVAWADFLTSLNPDLFYSFELCSPENRVGVIYPDRTLVLIAVVDKNTLAELDIIGVDCLMPKASYVDVRNMAEAEALVNTGMEAHQMEGYVLCDKNFIRAKVYNPRYMETMHLFGPRSEAEQLANLVQFSVTAVTIAYYTAYVAPIPMSFSTPALVTPKQALLPRVLALCKHIADNYERLSSGEEVDTSLWPEAYAEMKHGSAVTTIIAHTPEDRVLQVLHQFEGD